MNLKSSCLGFLGAEITDVSHHTQLSRDTLANTETRNNPQSEGSSAKKKKNHKYDGGKFKTKEN